MPTLNVSRVVNNPRFAKTFNITRSQGGSFDSTGTWQDAQVAIAMYGIIQPATPKELNQVEEGDRVKEVKSFHSSQAMFVTHTTGLTDTNAGLSDLVTIADGTQYRLVKLYPWADFGYYKALGVRIAGE